MWNISKRKCAYHTNTQFHKATYPAVSTVGHGSIEGILSSPLDSPFWNNTMRPPCNWFLPSEVSILKSVLWKWKWMNLFFSRNGNSSMPLGLIFIVAMLEFATEVSICKARVLEILIPLSLNALTTLLLRLQCRIVIALFSKIFMGIMFYLEMWFCNIHQRRWI